MPLHAVRHRSLSFAVALALSTAASLASAVKPQVDLEDHFEFDASLSAPYLANADHARDFGLQFRFPGANDGTMIVWRVDVLDNTGAAVRTWHGESKLADGLGAAQVNWSEFDPQNGPVPYGFYQARMQAYALDNYSERLGYGTLAQRVDSALRNNASEAVEQTFDIQVGTMTPPSMPAFAPLRTGAHLRANAMSVGATGGLPYTVYLGNLHSQTNHSDGGGPVSTCTGAQNPQSGVGGPAEAYQYALNEGLDILMTSEHNHMYDGSTGTNTSASPTTAHNLFQSGLSAATSFNSAHPGFLGVYGLEWGVITNGGHMNIFNTPSLLEWEYNSSNQLIGDVFTAKSDYGAMYTLMKANGWIGQFNHPATSAQFTVGGVDLAYTADGDQAMVLCEVMNSSAFSTSTTETETTHTSYEAACNKFLEAGYHVAFSTDQDNHCAQWGASYTNRTGVLIPNGTALSTQSFIDALKARHVYATYDKTSQLILSTSGGHIMGDQFNNSGSLTLTVNYAPGAGKSASQVQLMEGVPGSNGTVTVASTTSVTTLTPTNGLHFYYAKVTQNDGGLLFSAPVWVNQGAGGGDTTPPTVSASESGTSGTITLSASASDNVGVSKVEFYIDGALNATDTTSPYSTTVDSTTLANGSHNLVAKAYDAAGNVGTSSTVAFSVSNTTPDTTPPTVSASESGTSGTITLSATASDNVGVTKVEFYIDGTLNATDTTSPYSTTVDSTTLANGSHNLVAKAYDAAGNVGTSSTVAFSVSNTTPDTTPPTVSASESGTSGTITLSATASDNVGVTKVEFYIDGTLNATDTTSPYSTTVNSTTLANGSHNLVAKAYDAANNVGTSTTVAFTISNTVTATELIANGGFESTASWTASTGVICATGCTGESAHGGSGFAWLDGYGAATTDTVSQTVTIPSTATSATFSFWLHVDTAETTTTTKYDTLTVQLQNSSGTVLTTLATYSNLDHNTGYAQKNFDVSAYKGQTVKVYFKGVEDASYQTSFVLDDVSLKSQ